MDNKRLRLVSEDSGNRKVILLSNNSTADNRLEEGEFSDLKRKNSTSPIAEPDYMKLLANLASNDPKNRLESFEKFKTEIFKSNSVVERSNVLKVLGEEIFKLDSPIEIRIVSLDIITQFCALNQSELHSILLKLLRLACDDSSHVIRFQALMGVENVIKGNHVNWKIVSGLGGFLIEKEEGEAETETEADSNVSDFVKKSPFNILEKLMESSLNVSEIIFSVLSYLTCNDIHREVRLLAVQLIGRIPALSKRIRPEISLQQSIKKDQIKKTHGNLCLPLLCCGVFAHAIEDQFVKIRLNALISLYHLTKGKSSVVLNVFLDALLDECDLIRLAALKFIGQTSLAINSNLESLLAVLDDQNREIRLEALRIIGNNLKISTNSKKSTGIDNDEMLLRSQRCLEAALQKYPEMQFNIIESSFNFINGNCREIMKNCNDFASNLLQCQLPKYMRPASLLPYQHQGGLVSIVQSCMQMPFMSESEKEIKLVKIISRVQGASNREKLDFLIEKGIVTKVKMKKDTAIAGTSKKSAKRAKKKGNPDPVEGGNNEEMKTIGAEDIPSDNVSLFKLLIRSKRSLIQKYKIDQLLHPKNLSFYYFHPNSIDKHRPTAYFRIHSLAIKSNQVTIEDYKLIGNLENVALDLIVDDSRAYPFKVKNGKLVASIVNNLIGWKSLAVLNRSLNEIVYYK